MPVGRGIRAIPAPLSRLCGFLNQIILRRGSTCVQFPLECSTEFFLLLMADEVFLGDTVWEMSL